MDEIWKDIKGFEDSFMISSYGRIRNLSKRGSFLMKLSGASGGYSKATLCKSNKSRTVLIHRLVAEAFLPNPENKYCVNHKDGNKTNNNVDNLEWVSMSENMKHAYSIGLIKNANKIRVRDRNSGEIFESLSEAASKTNLSNSFLSMIFSGKRKNNTSLELVY